MGTAFVPAPATTARTTTLRRPAVSVRLPLYPTALAATVATGVFLTLHRLGAAGWSNDELIYRNAGRLYVAGELAANPEHPPLVKYILGVTQHFIGTSAAAVRLPSAICGLLTALVLFLLARRLAGKWAGLGVLAAWLLLPHPFGTMRVERMALLEPYMVLGVVTAVWAGERWASTGSWRWALGCAAAIGLAAACKVPGVLALPIVAIILLASGRRDRRTLGQLSAAAGVVVAVFLATYLPYGADMWATLGDMWDYQQRHAANGHPIVIAGTEYAHPPWWAAFWLFWSSSASVAVAYGACILGAALLLPRRTAVIAIAFALVWLGFFAFVSPFILRHYLYALSPALALLVGLVGVELYRRGRVGAVALGALLALLAPGSLTLLQNRAVASAPTAATPEAYAVAAGVLEEADLHQARVVVYGRRSLAAAYLPGAKFLSDASTADPARDVLLVDKVYMKATHPGWRVANLRSRLAGQGFVGPTAMPERHIPGGMHVLFPAGQVSAKVPDPAGFRRS